MSDNREQAGRDEQDAHPRWARPFIWVEERLEAVVHWLSRWALVDLAKLLGSLSIIWAAGAYLLGSGDRAEARADQMKAKHYQAWQVINLAQGRASNGGRTDALQDLVGDGVSLAGIDLDSARLRGLRIPNAILEEATLRFAVIDGGDLGGSSLKGSDLFAASFDRTCFSRADLTSVDLTSASLTFADLTAARLHHTHLDGADLRQANLDGAVLWNVRMRVHAQDAGPRAPVRRLLEASGQRTDSSTAAPVSNRMRLVEDDRQRFSAELDSLRTYRFRPVLLDNASLRGAKIIYAELRNAYLDSADVADATFRHVDLRGASLSGLRNWDRIASFDQVLLTGTERAPEGFMEFAHDMGAFVETIAGEHLWKVQLSEFWLSGYSAASIAALASNQPLSPPRADESFALNGCSSGGGRGD